MARPGINYTIAILLLITFLSSATTGILKFRPLMRLTGIPLQNLPMGTISSIHDWSGIILVLLILLHIILHWNWIICMTKKMLKKGGKCETK